MQIWILLMIVLGYLLIVNVLGFVLMFVDKKRAQNNQWRIKEATLFLTAAIGGSIGSMLGMKVFHHKTRHWYFKVFFPVLLVLQIALLAAGAYFLFL